MKTTHYQDAMVTLLKDVPDHDESTLVYHQLLDHARVVDNIVEDMIKDANRLIMYTNTFIRDMSEEAKEGRIPCGYLMSGTLNQDLHVRHAKYVARKDGLFTMVQLLLGASNYKMFLELVKNV